MGTNPCFWVHRYEKESLDSKAFLARQKKIEIQPRLMEADLCTETSLWKVIFHACCLVLGQAVVFCHRNVMFAFKGPTQEAFIMIQSNVSESRWHDFSGHRVLVDIPEQGLNLKKQTKKSLAGTSEPLVCWCILLCHEMKVLLSAYLVVPR